MRIMTIEQKIVLKKDRLNKLEQNGKNVDSPGVVKKLRREIKNANK